MTQADLLANQFSLEIVTLQDELITLRSQRDELIDAANSEIVEVGPKATEEATVDWFVMEQFKEPWKFRESFLETNKCTLITGLLFIVKHILNKIAKILIALVEVAFTSASAGTGAAVVAGRNLLCASFKTALLNPACFTSVEAPHGCGFWISNIFWAIKYGVVKIYEFFRGFDQEIKIWKILTGEYLNFRALLPFCSISYGFYADVSLRYSISFFLSHTMQILSG